MGRVRPGTPRVPVLLDVDWAGRSVSSELALTPTRTADAGEDHELTGGRIVDGLLWQVTRNELLWIDPRRMAVLERFSHRLFYDLHDVCPLPGGGFAVSCAGHESVLRFGSDRQLEHHHWLRDPAGGSVGFEAAYGSVRDWRVVPTSRTKPHSHHPNGLFLRGGQLWVTLFEQREARSLDGPGTIGLSEGPAHDGRLREGLLWFTTVTGHVVAVDPESLERRVHLDLHEITGSPRMLGWCRGIEVVGDRVFVGMTMLRRGRHRELLRRWVRGVRGEKLPTRIVELNWRERRLTAEMVLAPEGGTIYAINRDASRE